MCVNGAVTSQRRHIGHPEDRTVTVPYQWKRRKALWHGRLLEEQLGFFVANFDAPHTIPDAAVDSDSDDSDSDDSAKPPPKRRCTGLHSNLLTAATPPPDSARARRVTQAAARKAAAEQAETDLLEQLGCVDEQEAMDLAKAMSLSEAEAAAAAEAAATASRISIHGVPATGAPSVNIITHFSDDATSDARAKPRLGQVAGHTGDDTRRAFQAAALHVSGGSRRHDGGDDGYDGVGDRPSIFGKDPRSSNRSVAIDTCWRVASSSRIRSLRPLLLRPYLPRSLRLITDPRVLMAQIPKNV